MRRTTLRSRGATRIPTGGGERRGEVSWSVTHTDSTMNTRVLVAIAGTAIAIACASSAAPVSRPTTPAAQSSLPAPTRAEAAPSLPERAVRRDIPMTDMIRHAFALGTRDSTGHPGRNYWQTWVDYTITAQTDMERDGLVVVTYRLP